MEEHLGVRATGRVFALNSMENRVYDIEIEDEGRGRNVIAKFYRPGRWSKEQIGEEHSFFTRSPCPRITCYRSLPFVDGGTLAELKRGDREKADLLCRFSKSWRAEPSSRRLKRRRFFAPRPALGTSSQYRRLCTAHYRTKTQRRDLWSAALDYLGSTKFAFRLPILILQALLGGDKTGGNWAKNLQKHSVSTAIAM